MEVRGCGRREGARGGRIGRDKGRAPEMERRGEKPKLKERVEG